MSVGTIILIIYLLGVLIFWRPCARAMRHDLVDKYPSLPADGGDIAAIVFFATVLAGCWPVIVPPTILVRRVQRRTGGDALRIITGRTRDERIADMQKRIDELERENGL